MHSTTSNGTFTSKVVKVALSGALGIMMIPAVAFADYSPITDSGRVVMTNTTESGDTFGAVKKGAVVDNGDGTSTVTYGGYAHADGSHYTSYALSTTITWDNESGEITAIDFTSPADVAFAGTWGYKNLGKSMAAIEGYLPDGCSFSVTGSDGVYTPVMNTNGLECSFSSLTYYAVADDGTATPVKAATTSVPNASGRGSTTTYDEWDKTTGTLTLADATKEAGVNVVCITYQIGTESSVKFNTYFALTSDGSIDVTIAEALESAANKYIDSIQATTWEDYPDFENVYTNSQAKTNRGKWTTIMATIYKQRVLQSFGAYLATGNEDEICDIDTISGATKTSAPFIESLNDFVSERLDAGLPVGIAENLKVTIDGGTDVEYSANTTPKDQTTVSMNEDGEYVLNSYYPATIATTSTNGTVSLNSFNTYTCDTLTSVQIAALCKGNLELEAAGTYAPTKVITGYEEDDGDPIYSEALWENANDDAISCTVDSKACTATITVHDPDITYIAMDYPLAGVDSYIVYDLEQMYQVSQTIEAIDNIDDSVDAIKARAAYNSLVADVRGYVSNIDDLLAAEDQIVDGWVKCDGTYYLIKDGELATGWNKVGTKWYYMNDEGEMQASTWVKSGSKYCYVASSGAMVANAWQQVGGKWYWFDKSGYMVTGWNKCGSSSYYYFATSGAMQVSKWVKSGSTYYYVGANGKMYASKWLKSGGKWYWFKANGKMAKSETLTISGKKYTFAASGALK